MLPVNYIDLKFADVKDPMAFFKDSADKNEALKLKSLYEAMKVIFNINTNIKFQVAEGENIYKYIILSSDYRKVPIGFIIVIPKQRRLDIWNVGENFPLVQFKVRTAVFKNYSMLLEQAGVEKIFDRLVTIL